MGDYSRETLGAYERAWQVGQSPRALLRLCLFRHELGYHLPNSWNELLGTNLAKLRGVDFETATMLRCRRRSPPRPSRSDARCCNLREQART